MRSKILLTAFLSLTVLGACGKGVRPETRDTVRFSALETDAVESQVIEDPGPQANDEQLSTYKPIVQGVRENRGDLFVRDDVGTQLERIEGVFIATGEYLELVRYYQDAVEQKGPNTPVGRRLAWALIRIGQQKQARAVIDDLMKAAPDDALVYFLDGSYYLQDERDSTDARKKAIAGWSRALEMDPNFRGYAGITADMMKTQVQRMTESLPPEERAVEEPAGPEDTAASLAKAVASKANVASRPVDEQPEQPEVVEEPAEPVEPVEAAEEPAEPAELADAERRYKLLVARGEMALAASKFEEAETLFLQAKKIRPDGFSAELGQLQSGWGVESARNTIVQRARKLAERELSGDEAFRLGRFVWTRMQDRELATKLLEEAKVKAPNRAPAADAILGTMR